jgi:hypothetical protein
MSHRKSLGDFDVITGPAAPSRPISPAALPRPAALNAAEPKPPRPTPAASGSPARPDRQKT